MCSVSPVRADLGRPEAAGAVVLGLIYFAAAWRGDNPTAFRAGFRTLLYAGIPGYIVMRGASEWILSKEGLGDLTAARLDRDRLHRRRRGAALPADRDDRLGHLVAARARSGRRGRGQDRRGAHLGRAVRSAGGRVRRRRLGDDHEAGLEPALTSSTRVGCGSSGTELRGLLVAVAERGDEAMTTASMLGRVPKRPCRQLRPSDRGARILPMRIASPFETYAIACIFSINVIQPRTHGR